MARENIPGISIHYKDGGLAVPVVEQTLTDTVLVIGTAVDGPVGEPIRIPYSAAESVFGPLVYDTNYTVPTTSTALSGSFNGNYLLKGLNEVFSGGATDVVLMRAGGTYATATLTGAGYNIRIRSIYPGRIYNSISAVFTSGATAKFTVAQSGIGKGATLSYTLSGAAGGKTIAQLINEVNSDVNNRTIRIEAVYTSALGALAPSTLSYTAALTGGSNGCVGDGLATLKDLRNILADPTTGAFALLEDMDVDIVYLSGIYADDDVSAGSNGSMSIATDLASACFLGAINSYPKIGVIGIRPILQTDRATVASRVTALTTNTMSAIDTGRSLSQFGWFMSAANESSSTQFVATDPRNNMPVDSGRFVQVMAGPDVLLSQKQLGSYIENPAGLYAGFVSTLPPHSAATGKILPGVEGLAYDYTIKQVNMLAGGQPFNSAVGIMQSGWGGAYVALRKNSRGQVIVNLDNTAAIRKSDYAKLQVLRIVDAVVGGIREISLQFIGEPNELTTKMSLKNKIRLFLDTVAGTRAIAGGEGVGYSFTVTADRVDQVLGRLRIELTLKPALQIQSINVTINLVPPDGG